MIPPAPVPAETYALILTALNVLVPPGTVVELRMPTRTKRGVLSGYFNNLHELAQWAATFSGSVPAIYISVNPVATALLARAVNHVIERAPHTTSDKDITQRVWLLIDIDPNRPSGISATDDEHDAALDRARAVASWLADQGWPRPIIVDSGNGTYVMFRIDLLNDEAARPLIQRCLDALDFKFSDERVTIDRSVASAGQLMRVPGTVNGKGDATHERPHRVVTLIEGDREMTPVSRAQLEQLAAMAPRALSQRKSSTRRGSGLDLDRWLAQHANQLSIVSTAPWNGGRKWIVDPCPWNATHTNRSAYIVQLASGAVAAGCHHNGCADKDWRALQSLFETAGDRRHRAGGQGSEEEAGDEAETDDEAEPIDPYIIENGRICRVKLTRLGVVVEPLCNFVASVREEILLDDGVETTRAFIMEGRLDTGESLPPSRIAAGRFSGMAWVPESWGLRAVVCAGLATRDQLREGIQRLSPAAQRRHVFTHTGWREFDGVWVYVTTSGAVGREGVEVDLGPELTRYRLPQSPEDSVDAMRQSLKLLTLAPFAVTVPLFAAVYRAPLASVAPCDVSVWMEGQTGSLKSTLAALFLSHYGNFDRTHLPGGWSFTANALEKRAFTLKDSLFVIDDYAPTPLTARELATTAQRVLRAQGNLAGRGRLRSDLSERPAFPPRGLIVGTGEEHPPGQSLMARLLVVPVRREDVDLGALSGAQQGAARLPHALAGYIMWLSPRMPALARWLNELFERRRAAAMTGATHLRIPEAVAHCWLGIAVALQYAEEIGACSAAEAVALRQQAWAALLELGAAHGRLVDAERPTRLFLTTLATLITQGHVVLRLRSTGSEVVLPGMNLIGWEDQDAIYLMGDAAFAAVSRFCREANEPFPVPSDRLRRELAEEGLSENDPGRHTKVVKIGPKLRRVLVLKRAKVEALLGVEFPGSIFDPARATGFTGVTGP